MLTAVATLVILAGSLPVAVTRAEGLDHLLIDEIATGGLGANDEFIELFNPGPEPFPLGGVELAYASASGASVSRRASWAADAAPVPPGGHLLIANEAGAHAAAADTLYQGGLAEAGGTVILRLLGAPTAIDAVAWGTAAGSWLEGRAAPAPPPGSSLQRLTGPDGFMQDTGDNATDFAVLAVPTPQAADTPSPTAMPTVTPAVTPTPTASPAPTQGGTVPASPSP
ncbi:MAG: lamin tail domain-containing protein, partial [Chloroflexi bacterium]|nr:lamin tail domain-containing protein [Chloroflexota bacterium]